MPAMLDWATNAAGVLVVASAIAIVPVLILWATLRTLVLQIRAGERHLDPVAAWMAIGITALSCGGLTLAPALLQG